MSAPSFNYIYSLFRVMDQGSRPQLLSFWCLLVEFKQQLAFFQISSTGSGDVHASSKMVSPAWGPNTGVQIKADLPNFSLVAEHSDQEER